MSDRHGIGGNNPPLGERLALDYADLTRRAAALAASFAPPDAIATEAQALEVGAFVRETREIAKEMAAAKQLEKRPYIDAGKEIETFFTRSGVALGSLDALARELLGRYAGKKARDAAAAAKAFDMTAPATKDAARIHGDGGVSVSATSRWTYDIVDRTAVPLELMAPSDAAIKARIAQLKATGAPMAIPGLALREEMGVSVR